MPDRHSDSDILLRRAFTSAPLFQLGLSGAGAAVRKRPKGSRCVRTEYKHSRQKNERTNDGRRRPSTLWHTVTRSVTVPEHHPPSPPIKTEPTIPPSLLRRLLSVCQSRPVSVPSSVAYFQHTPTNTICTLNRTNFFHLTWIMKYLIIFTRVVEGLRWALQAEYRSSPV